MDAIRTRGLSRRLAPGFSVSGVSLTVPAGSVYALLGPNGAGKTTLIRLVTTLLRPDAGTVEVMGIDALRRGAQARGTMGYVPDRPAAPDWGRVERALAYHGAFFPRWDAGFARSLLRRLGVPGDRPVRHLSKGEAEKLSLVMALGHRPPLLVLDEPTGGLDPLARREITAILLEYVADTGATVFLASHLAHELERFADRVGVMRGGRLVAETTLEEFRGAVKRLRVAAPAPADAAGLPLDVLSREARGRDEVWAVRGWDPAMTPALAARGVEVREVLDLDLEESYVELLRHPARDEAVHAA